MIVCLCEAVRGREIRRCIGAGARTVREVGSRCGAGTDCGQCVRDIRRMIDETPRSAPVEEVLAAK